MKLNIFLILIILVAVFSRCRREDKFDEIGTGLSGPIGAAPSSDGKYFYVLNSDFDRKFNQGSVLTIQENGDKVSAIAIQRMGRQIISAGNDLFVTVDQQDSDVGPKLYLYDISDPKNLVEKKVFDLNCSPLNIVAREQYQYFVVACTNGGFYLGELKADRGTSTLTRVRDYGFARRAIFLDSAHNQVLSFPTNINAQTMSDYIGDDKDGWNADGSSTGVSNDVPDDFENTPIARAAKQKRQKFQYTVYDIATEQVVGFPYRGGRDLIYQNEFRFIYFSLANFDGTPDPVAAGFTNNNAKYYRTNFWAARPDPNNINAFYVSQRDHGTTRSGTVVDGNYVVTGNHIVKVTLKGSLAPVNGLAPLTKNVMDFERVYGFKGEMTNNGTLAYPGEFEIRDVQGQRMLIVNHFRDLFNWPRSQSYFSIAAKVLGQNSWFIEKSTQDAYASYYNFAYNSRGRAAVSTFYGNSLILLDILPGADIVEVRTIL